MKKIFSLLFLTLFIDYQSFSQDTAYARTIINTLSSEEFAGRGYVENGLEKSAEYIIAEYLKIGLKPFKNEFRQTFSYGINTFPGKMELGINGNQLIPGTDFLIDPVSPSCKGNFSVVCVLSSDLLDHMKLSKVIKTLQNRFLIIDDRSDSKLSNEDAKTLSDLMNFLKYSPNIKSAGTIVLSNEKLTWSPAVVSLSRPVFTVRTDVLLSEIKEVEVDVEAVYFPEFKSSNLIGYIEGKTVPDSFLVITAHYDHLGKMGKEIYFPGANDNSSGIAMMLNLAKYFSLAGTKYSMVFIALTGEEAGLLGAKYYTENPWFDLQNIKFLVNFDLAGTGDEGIKVVNATVYPNQFELLSGLNSEYGYLSSVQKRGEACNSDHCQFYSKDVPCFYIYTLGGSKAYHDIHDRSSNLPLTEFGSYFKLMAEFFKAL